MYVNGHSRTCSNVASNLSPVYSTSNVSFSVSRSSNPTMISREDTEAVTASERG